ncbi:MAG TPA: L,D-transpeptidase [Bryobacteraceae bacterium]
MSKQRWIVGTLFLGLTIGSQAHPAKKPKGRADRTAVQPPWTLDLAGIARPEQPDVSIGAKGEAVVRAQILLARAHFSCGELDGNFGTNLQKTVSAFQGDRRLPTTGMVDPATWAALNTDQAPILIAYAIAQEDENGPFTPIPGDLMQQAKLPALGYTSPLEELAERFHASPKLLQALNPGADFGKVGQALMVPNAITMPPGQAASITVSKGESSVRAWDATGKLLAFYVATTGSEHDPLPIGNWKINGQKRDPDFHYNANLFWDAKNPNDKAIIKPGPNNPVGLVWMDLSKDHYGIHGTPEPSLVGHATSHGCIRLTNWDALDLAAMVKPGTPAVLKE